MLTLILTLTLCTCQVVLSTPLLFASFFILINALRGAATLLIQVHTHMHMHMHMHTHTHTHTHMHVRMHVHMHMHVHVHVLE